MKPSCNANDQIQGIDLLLNEDCILTCYAPLIPYKRQLVEGLLHSDEEITALLELMRLPGVKAIRAQLYYHCGLKSLADFAAADAESLREHIITVIAQDGLPFSPPLPKELRTQIAVAKVFTEYAVP